MTIIEYRSRNDILVEFEDGYKIKTRYDHFKNREVNNPHDKTVYEIGYLGEGNCDIDNIKNTYKKQYVTWKSMIERCYNKKYQERRPTYIGCSVCNEWHNFQNFVKWFDENYYEIEGQRMELDKDILIKGNKIYSPKTCVLVPNHINTLFIKSNAIRGQYPIGVSFSNQSNNYMASGKNVFLGYHDTPKKAFNAYKTYKEKTIKNVADKYKNQIPQKLYNAMYNYQVEITD